MFAKIWLRGVARHWPDVLRDSPRGLVHRRGDGWVVARPPNATTGLPLGTSGGDLFIQLPLFFGDDEYAHAEALIPMCAAASRGRIEVDGRTVPAKDWEMELKRLALQLVDARVATVPRLLASPNTILEIEGWRRPYFLGQSTLNLLLRTGPPAGLLERLQSAIAAMQALPDEMVAPVERFSRDGRGVTAAIWDLTSERLVPPCDELVFRHRGASWHVASAHLADVIPANGVRLDERHWLVLALSVPEIAALTARARPFVGRP